MLFTVLFKMRKYSLNFPNFWLFYYLLHHFSSGKVSCWFCNITRVDYQMPSQKTYVDATATRAYNSWKRTGENPRNVIFFLAFLKTSSILSLFSFFFFLCFLLAFLYFSLAAWFITHQGAFKCKWDLQLPKQYCFPLPIIHAAGFSCP